MVAHPNMQLRFIPLLKHKCAHGIVGSFAGAAQPVHAALLCVAMSQRWSAWWQAGMNACGLQHRSLSQWSFPATRCYIGTLIDDSGLKGAGHQWHRMFTLQLDELLSELGTPSP